jgi:hypothetical protein
MTETTKDIVAELKQIVLDALSILRRGKGQNGRQPVEG